MQPFQYDLRCPAPKTNSITHPAAAPSNLDATITMRSAQTELQNTKELRAKTLPKRRLSSHFHCDLERLSCKSQKNYAQKRYQNDAWTGSSTAGPIRPWSEHSRDRLGPVRPTSFPTHHPRHVLSCKIHDFVHPLSRKNAFRARLPSNSKCTRYENEAFVRDFLHIPSVQGMKTKLSCETSFQFKLRDVQTFRHSNFQTSRLTRHSNFQTSRLSDIQTCRHSNFQTSRLSRHSNCETFKLSDHHSTTFQKIRNSEILLSSFLREYIVLAPWRVGPLDSKPGGWIPKDGGHLMIILSSYHLWR